MQSQRVAKRRWQIEEKDQANDPGRKSTCHHAGIGWRSAQQSFRSDQKNVPWLDESPWWAPHASLASGKEKGLEKRRASFFSFPNVLKLENYLCLEKFVRKNFTFFRTLWRFPEELETASGYKRRTWWRSRRRMFSKKQRPSTVSKLIRELLKTLRQHIVDRTYYFSEAKLVIIYEKVAWAIKKYDNMRLGH